jgi:hypothetical protein
MTDARTIDTLRSTIATLTRFIEAKSTSQNSRDKAIETRDDLQRELNAMLEKFIHV